MLDTNFERPKIIFKSQQAPLRLQIGVKSKATVTHLSPKEVRNRTCFSTPMTLPTHSSHADHVEREASVTTQWQTAFLELTVSARQAVRNETTHKLTAGLSEFPGSLVELPNQGFGQARADRLLVLTEELRTPWQHLPGSVTFARFEALRICFKIGVGNGDPSRKAVGFFWFLAHCPLPHRSKYFCHRFL